MPVYLYPVGIPRSTGHQQRRRVNWTPRRLQRLFTQRTTDTATNTNNPRHRYVPWTTDTTGKDVPGVTTRGRSRAQGFSAGAIGRDFTGMKIEGHEKDPGFVSPRQN
ncbi:unnamed protein product [Pleuronectes platessa]|uniref:Uncharacterized protein n=1 Tax=Pleuronectes platessa TaxID=8262 RepID=A0A9N7YTD6_PLEPL|nr:unnamed protein product [Pleuronectes platessa]